MILPALFSLMMNSQRRRSMSNAPITRIAALGGVAREQFAMIAAVVALLFAGFRPASADDTPPALPPPRAALPALPAGSDGVYRLHLEGFFSDGAALWIMLAVEDGRVVRSMALPLHQDHDQGAGLLACWAEADTTALRVTAERVAGSVAVGLLPNRDPRSERPKAGVEAKPAPLAIALDLTVAGAGGTGTWSAAASPQRVQKFGGGKPAERGTAILRRETAPELSGNYDLEFHLPTALGARAPGGDPALWLRLRMGGNAEPQAAGWIRVGYHDVRPILWSKVRVTFAAGRVEGSLAGTLPGEGGAPFTLTIDGRLVGRNLCGTAALALGGETITSPWVGFLDRVSWRLPLAEPVAPWTWRHDADPDPALVAAAVEDAQRPVLPGEPGKAGFWTWRQLIDNPHPPERVSVIHPPSFDIEEVAGAVRYRMTVTPKRGGGAVSCEVDRPWRPLTPLWRNLAPGSWRLTVVALDSAGKEISGPMRMGVGQRPPPEQGGNDGPYQPPARVVVETGPIPFEKRPSFDGPYWGAAPARTWTAAALAAAMWEHSLPGLSTRRGLAGSVWWRTAGEGGFPNHLVPPLWSELAIRALSTEPAERAQSEQLLHMWQEAVRQHQALAGGTFHTYKGYTPLTHWPAEAVLDAWLQTGDPAWKECGLAYGRALVKLQNPNGTFGERRGHSADLQQEPLPGPDRLGLFSYSLSKVRHQAQFGAAELLYVLGRLRRDLGTNEFRDAERLAWRWVREVAVRERYFTLYVHHSHSVTWPQRQHAMSALYIARWLLECAPAEDRDLALAAELARWAEDVGVDWTRAGAGPQQGRVTPRIGALDRINNEPAAVNLLAAIVFHRLGQETGETLWIAKGQALATAVVMAQDPVSGYLHPGLEPRMSSDWLRQFNDALYHCLSFCRGWGVQLLREYAAVAATGPGTTKVGERSKEAGTTDSPGKPAEPSR